MANRRPKSTRFPAIKLAGNKRRSFSGQGGLLNRMFGSSPNPIPEEAPVNNDDQAAKEAVQPLAIPAGENTEKAGAKNGSPTSPRKSTDDVNPTSDRKRRSSGVAKAKDIFSSAKQSLHLHGSTATNDKSPQSSMQKLSRSDPALSVPQGSHNNSAGESLPGPKSTFRVGVTEDKNKKCRRTMEDTHAYLYNFLSTPAASSSVKIDGRQAASDANSGDIVETDNGYFAIFDGHAGTFAADWCGKKLHHILEDTIRKSPNTPVPELLDQTFTVVDQQLEKLPLKNSGCTAVIAVLRWEDRVPNPASATGSTYLNQAAAKVMSEPQPTGGSDATQTNAQSHAENSVAGADARSSVTESKLKESASRQRVLYTANVGDARIVLCRSGRALRLSYDHKGSDENEGRRVANAGGLILNNRVNGVLAVTRALGDAYMKELVTGHPYTTETVIQPDQDEFIILACDGLWDVCTDQEAVDLVRSIPDPQAASKKLVDHALQRFSTDNLSCMIVRFDNDALKKRKVEASIGVAGDKETAPVGTSEADAIVSQAKKHREETGQIPPILDADAIAEEQIAEAKTDPGPELDLKAAEKAQKHPPAGQSDGATAATDVTGQNSAAKS